MSTSSVSSGTTLDCPNRPSCVSSRAHNHSQQVEALRYSSELEAALSRLADIVDATPRAMVSSRTKTSLHASFRSRWFGFTDDVDFVAGDEGVIDVRSMSRLGYYDFGVNRRRIEAIRARFEGQ